MEKLLKKLVYYALHSATESEKVGSWPQLEASRGYYKVKNNFVTLDNREFPDETPNLDTFTLKRIARQTDVLSADMLHSSIGIYVSDTFKNLVKKYDILNFRFYDCQLAVPDPSYKTKKTEQLPFNFLHLIDRKDNIDFTQSVFWDLKEEKLITVDHVEQLPMFNFRRKLVLKKAPDLFREPFSIGVLVSERLKIAMEEAGITGIWFEEFNNPANPELFIEE
ncbi:imm11 family protein [Chryseobacterium sp. 2987]|uniref:imm11 family protein n=1 Tax=Chryseobacterium sp. 2987 TaxID=2817767 RepID=UPI002862AF29|nr:DUF1629 domain-containing protein [Chryseobacterium sp. 2987]MDR6919747.1 hypothetical protein [Chryseobacterium sp. 2987]